MVFDANEAARLDALHALHILDTVPEAVFDELTFLAAHVCSTPISLMSLVDADRQWIKSRVGLDVHETSREVAFCAHAIGQPDLFVVPDAQRDARFAHNPLVTGAPGIRFYAGAPLVLPEGMAVGTLCVIDRTPRTLTADQLRALRALRDSVVAQLILRRSVADLSAALRERAQADEARRLSEERYRALATTVPVGVFRTDAQGQCTYVNDRWCTITGVSASAAYGTGWLGALHAEDRPMVERAWREAVQRGEAFHQEYRFGGAGSPARWVLGQAVPDPVLGGWVGCITDITGRKQIEDELRQSEARFRTVFERAPVGIAEVTPDGTWLRVNQTLCRLLGYSPEELTALTFHDLTHPDDPHVDLVQARRVATDPHEPHAIEKRYIRRDGSPVWVQVTAAVIGGAEADADHIIRVIENIDDRKRQEREVRRLHAELLTRADELRVANAELDAFSYAVSHDLRAPLRSIKGFAQAVLDAMPDATSQHGDLERVVRAAVRMERLIEALLRLSRIGGAAVRPAIVDLSAVVAGIAQRLTRDSADRQIEWVLASGLTAYADPDLITVALENLLHNAWKYTAGRARARIEFGAVPSALTPTFYVRDNGIGFETDAPERLFQPFTRFHSSEFEGTGIGLATVHRIIVRHGGTIRAESTPGAGTTVFFTLGQESAITVPAEPCECSSEERGRS